MKIVLNVTTTTGVPLSCWSAKMRVALESAHRIELTQS